MAELSERLQTTLGGLTGSTRSSAVAALERGRVQEHFRNRDRTIENHSLVVN